MYDIPRRPVRSLLALALSLAAVAAAQEGAPEAADGEAESGKPPAALAVAAINVTPEKPGTATLCRLEVTIRNRATQPVSALAFRVELDGVPLSVYERQLFVETLPAGKETVVELFNFWTSESDRPAPADGTIDLRVTLTEARWLTRDVTDDDTEILTLGEAVPDLPSSASVLLALER